MEREDLDILKESIKEDNLLGRLEKLTVFMDSMSYSIVHQEFSEEDPDLALKRVATQKKLYADSYRLFDLMKEDEINKEEAGVALEELAKSLEEFKRLREKKQ